uniref:Adiponectin receptor protein n=1 Tax=Panagrellus redivivus TaxID=6233 RepID=A0A7E4VCR2_PANRE
MSGKDSVSSNRRNDFVSPNVNEALQEARLIATQGKASPTNKNEHVLEDSTTFQVIKSDSNKSPVEVVISRSKVVSQSDDGTRTVHSDPNLSSDERTDPTQLSSKSTENLLDADYNEHHTNVRYRRKQLGMWERENEGEAHTARKADEAELSVDVSEQLQADSEGHQLMLTTWSARWTVQNYEQLPEWLQDNEFLRTGHRPPLPSFAECFKSILSLHTETGNIWTHLIGCVAFLGLAIWFLTRPKSHIDFQEKLVFSFFFASAIACLGLSFLFHTVSCHSVRVGRLFCKLDYVGISMLIVGSFIPWVYYGFYCRREPKITYIAMVTVLGAAAVVVSLWDRFSESRYRPLRAGVFVLMGCSGVIPTFHFVYTDGVRRLIDENSFYWLLAMAGLYLFGALLYATRTPERFFPGKCDIWFQSHQLFHLCVVVAAFTHFYGIQEMAYKRLTDKCPNEEGYIPRDYSHSEL